MANKFSLAIKEADNSKILGIASKSKLKLNKFGNLNNVDTKLFFEDYKELISNKYIDAIYISTLNNTHFDLINLCIKNKKSILCEKPFVLNLNQAKEIFTSIKKNKIHFIEAIAYRSHPQTKKLLDLIEKGEIGKISKIEAFFGFKVKKINNKSRLFNKDYGGGAILDLGCYPISFFNLFSDEKNKMNFINCQGTFCSTGVDDEAKINLKIGKNIEAVAEISLKNNLENICKIYGDKGTIKISSPWLPFKKSYLEVNTKNHYYKQFINTSKDVYTHQLEKVENYFLNKNLNEELLVDINESIEIMNILDTWNKNLKK